MRVHLRARPLDPPRAPPLLALAPQQARAPRQLERAELALDIAGEPHAAERAAPEHAFKLQRERRARYDRTGLERAG